MISVLSISRIVTPSFWDPNIMLLGATPGSSGVTIKLSPLSCNSVLSRPIRQRGYYTLWLLSAAAEGRWVIVRHGGRSGNGWYFYLPTDSYHFPFQSNTIILKHPNIVSCWALSPDSRALSPSSRPLSHIKYQNIKVHYQGFLEHPKFQESDQ